MFSNGFSELVLIVNDVLEAAAFYRDVVGLVPETEADADWAWFWAGEVGTPQRIALHAGPLLFEEYSPFPAGQRWGHVHFALNVSSDKLEAASSHVRSQGVQVHGPQRFPWMHATSFYFYDLDGNLIEFWSLEDGSTDEAPGANVS
jgi:catechol 2,3-dioxygenase-like lactoylglutathione lyase family enzyme